MSKLIIPGETQPGKLIVPGNEPVKPLIKATTMGRRGFMGVLAAAFTGTVVAPMIVPYASLMKIDTPMNRLVYAFMGGHDTGDVWVKSLLNLGECLDPIVRAQWEGQGRNVDLTYDLVREAEIPKQYEHRWGPHSYERWDQASNRYVLDEQALRRKRAQFKQFVDDFRSHRYFRIGEGGL